MINLLIKTYYFINIINILIKTHYFIQIRRLLLASSVFEYLTGIGSSLGSQISILKGSPSAATGCHRLPQPATGCQTFWPCQGVPPLILLCFGGVGGRGGSL